MSWKETLATVAPGIATALGGPLAGMAVKIATDALGIEADPKKLEETILTGNPESLLKLKEAEQNYKLEVKRLQIDLEKIHGADRDSARKREIATKDKTPKILATVILVGFFSVLGIIAFVTIPVAAVQPLNILLGALTALTVQVGNYYFGSSAGSARKTELLKNGNR